MSGFNYGRVLNIPEFQVCQVFAYASFFYKVLNMSEYDCKMAYGRVLNMLGQRLTGF